jgi:large subunit ribosomal protein L6
MSRIGKKPVAVPANVKVAVNSRVISVEGPKGKLEWEFRPEISVEHDAAAKSLSVSRHSEERLARALHGLTRAVLQNMMVGVTQGYEKRLELVGVGYISAVQGQTLQLRVGLANELQVPIPAGLKVACPDQQHIVIQGIDKQLVGQFAAEVRALRKPEPYKGKGIRYLNEQVRRKQGKAMVK